MKTIFIAAFAGAASLALAACNDPAEETVVADDAFVTEATPLPADPALTTDPLQPPPGVGDSTVTASPDGVEANINSGDTSVTADIDEDPAVTVRD